MKITHHLDDATLMSCAAGSQPEPMAAVVASHLSVCPSCLSGLRGFERVGEVLFDGLETVGLDRPAPIVAMRAGQQDGETLVRANTDAKRTEVPAPLRHLIGDDLDSIHWKRLAPGLWHYPLPLSAHTKGDLRLIKVGPGVAMPDHGHGGSELTYVLRGSYTDKLGTFRAGDVADLGDDVEHQPIADPVEGCICLIASDSKAKFKGWVARMMQPLVGL